MLSTWYKLIHQEMDLALVEAKEAPENSPSVALRALDVEKMKSMQHREHGGPRRLGARAGY